MNPTLEPYIKKLLDGGMKTAEEAVAFIETQAPQLMHETIVWGAASEVIAPLLGLILMIFSVGFHYIFSKKWDEDGYWKSKEWPGVAITIICATVGTVMFFVEIMDFLYPLIAPRVFLLEKISNLIK